MKKIILSLFLLFSFFVINTDVYALPSLSLNENDYELICIYDDGAELTISRDEIYIINRSNSLNSNSNSNISFYLTLFQRELTDTNGNVVRQMNNVLNKGHCPTTLYVYKVASSDDENVAEEERLDEDVFNYYYSTKSGIASNIAGTHRGGFLWLSKKSNAVQLKDESGKNIKVTLKSEEVNLLTSKETIVCDYQSKTDDYLGNNSISIYLYEDFPLVENGGRITPLWKNQTTCPVQKGTLYLNDPAPRSVGGAYSGNYQYNYVRFSFDSSAAVCKDDRNNGDECSAYQFIGSRNSTPGGSGEIDPCKLLGNDTITILREIISWLQIIVPALVIILIGVDITKMVLAGNLDDELPKKKKSIIIRLIIMVIFFFAPTIATVIIQLLIDAGVNIGDIKCLIS